MSDCNVKRLKCEEIKDKCKVLMTRHQTNTRQLQHQGQRQETEQGAALLNRQKQRVRSCVGQKTLRKILRSIDQQPTQIYT